MRRSDESNCCVAGSITAFGPPPDGADLLAPANEPLLAGLGLPRKPLGDCARGLWRRMLEGACIEAPSYVCDPYEEVPSPDFLPVRRSLLRAARPRQGSRTQRSRNWSGAWIVPRDGRRFVSVWGSWTVPETPAPHETEQPPPDQARAPDWARCSHWIGIGGHRRHSRSLPQVGTMTAINKKREVRYYAWYQWWEATRSYGPLRITNLDVEAGHSIIAAVTAEARDRVRLHIRNENTRQLRSIEWQTDADRAPAEVDGKSAEWVVERPSWFGRDGKPRFFQLPRFGSLRFDCCHAEVAETLDASPVARDLDGARLVRMVGRGGTPRGSRFLAVPKKRGTDVLDVEDRHRL